MEEWKKTQLDQVIRVLRSSDMQLYTMARDRIPNIDQLTTIHFAIKTCIDRLNTVRGEEPIDEVKLKQGK